PDWTLIEPQAKTPSHHFLNTRKPLSHDKLHYTTYSLLIMKFSTYANPLALLLLTSTQQVAGWGQLGHRTVALLAERFLLPETKEFTKHILYGESLANAAVWPDYFAHKPEGRYSK